MGSGEHPLELGCLNPQSQLLIHAVDLGQGGLIFGFLTQFDHDPDIIGLPVECIPTLQQLFEYGAFFQNIL
jgi:hypothetical protein